jgi:lipopolysaccharide assembly outer membrane protein LptD (OstA)
MKTMTLLLLVFGFAILGAAQTTAPVVEMTATNVVRDGNVRHLRGKVEINVGGVVIVADEADVHRDTNEADLRGNVHVKSSQPANQQ